MASIRNVTQLGGKRVKKLLNKRGFTIVEVLVAFVIFAIMAAMVSVIIAGTNQAKRENIKLEEEIMKQQEKYYLNTQEMKYDSSKKAGTLDFGFKGKDSSSLNVEVGYNIADPNDPSDDNAIALEYFITDGNYTNGKDDSKNTTPGSVTSKLDTRVYGSNGIDRVTMKVTKDSSYSGTGYRYFIKSMATYSGLDQVKWFAQYRIIFPSKILDYGYTDQKDNPPKIYSRFEYTGYQFEVYAPYSRTLRISTRQDTTESKPIAIGAKYVYYYVVLEDELEKVDSSLDCNKIFGYSDTKQTSTKTASGCFEFTPYVEIQKDENTGVETTVRHINIFGAFPKEEKPEKGGATAEATP